MLMRSIALLIVATVLVCPLSSGERSEYSRPNMIGNRSVIVQMFEWRFDDLAEECENFLGPYGYGGIQTSPVLEYAMIKDNRPWWERYQPVSYKIISRSGNAEQLSNMIERCNRAGVRVYVDIVINHMAGPMIGQGVGGTPFNGNAKDFPGVPYGPQHFNDKSKCPSQSGGIEDWRNPEQIRNCELVGLRDLDASQDHVRQKIADAMNSLIRLGVAGFRVDATKHMWVEDVKAILDRVDNLNTQYFQSNERPFIYHEISHDGSKEGIQPEEYLPVGSPLEFMYRRNLVNVFRKYDNQKLRWLRNWGEPWDLLPSDSAVPFVDNHDFQRSEIDTGISFRQPRLLKMATAFMLAWPYGTPEVMSSYEYEVDPNHREVDNTGPPMDQDGNIVGAKTNPDLSCQAPWRCEHRWRQIYNMVKFREVAEYEPVENWQCPSDNVIAFSRGSSAFIVIVNDNIQVNQEFQTNLPAGRYCDVISGNIERNGETKCTGKVIEVKDGGKALITIDGERDEDPMVAIHIQARL
ncbi:alpha-amylase-like [Brevipalpus obovatus]|uniref:alpha-amylase-like n=1 Tax=Brevipalpus obovatus TaxID=246614 RepID=UPI003D9F3388